MITTCTVCQARYQLDAERIPLRVIKVRCPSCSGVFTLDGTQVTRDESRDEPLAVTTGFNDYHAPSEPAAPEAPAAAPEPAPAETPVQSTPEPAPEPAPEPVAATGGVEFQAPTAEADPEPEPEAEPETGTATAVMDEPAPRRRKSKEEMLARALVSDIMVYNRELYDTAKAEDNLLEALGAEIKKSWELYKEKVGEDVANDSDHFRNALNDILADGEKIF